MEQNQMKSNQNEKREENLENRNKQPIIIKEINTDIHKTKSNETRMKRKPETRKNKEK